MARHRREDEPRHLVELQPLAAGLGHMPPARRLLRLPGALERHRRLRGERRELREVRLASEAGALAADRQQAEGGLARDQRRGEQQAGAIERSQRARGVLRVHHRLRQAQRPAPVGEELRRTLRLELELRFEPCRDALGRPPLAGREDEPRRIAPARDQGPFELPADLLRFEDAGDTAAEIDHPFELTGTTPQLADTRALRAEPERHQGERHQPEEPGPHPERHRDRHRQGRGESPVLTVQGGQDVESMRTCGNRRILGEAARTGIDPVAVDALEPVAELQPVRSAQVNCREVDLQTIVSRRERNRCVESDTASVDANRFDDRRRQRQRLDRSRIDDRRTFHRREPEPAVAGADSGVAVAALESRRRQPVLGAEQPVAHPRRAPVEVGIEVTQRHAREAARTRDPQVAEPVVDDRPGSVVEEPVLAAQKPEFATAVAHEAAFEGAEPEVAARILGGAHEELMQRLDRGLVLHGPAVGENFEETVLGRRPDRAPGVGEQAEDDVGPQGLLHPAPRFEPQQRTAGFRALRGGADPEPVRPECAEARRSAARAECHRGAAV